MQWRLSHRVPRVIKLKSCPKYRYFDDDDLGEDEDKDCYEVDLDDDMDEVDDEVECEDDDGERESDEPICSSEELVNSQLTLPNFKPDIDRVLRVAVKAQVQHWENVRTAHGTKLVVTGCLLVGVEYVAKVLEQSMHFAQFDLPFHTFFFCSEKVHRVTSSVDYLRHDTIDPRSIDLAVLVNIEAF